MSEVTAISYVLAHPSKPMCDQLDNSPSGGIVIPCFPRDLEGLSVKFAGQIRVPEVDHPGVPATFVVDDNQAEVILEGESLGRWSLFDVHVTRLVSSAFQVELAGEEITFLADEPVDFAYKGVEHMAEAWARYKTMTVPSPNATRRSGSRQSV